MIGLMVVLSTFRLTYKVKMLWLYMWNWSKQWEILLVVIIKSCLWWFDSYWGGMKLRILVVGRFKCRKMGWPLKEEFFTNNSVEALIPLKEGHQGLLRLHAHLQGVSQCGEKMGLSPKREFCLKQEKNMWQGFSGSIEILCTFWIGLGRF